MVALKVVAFAAAACLASSNAHTGDEQVSLALPDIDYFMKNAQNPLEEFGEQAEMLKKQAVQHEREKQETIVRMKAAFEKNLTAQAHECEKIVEESHKLNYAITREQEAIVGLRQDSKKVQKSNDLMRTALETIAAKIHLSSNFVTDSLESTDDSNASELDVLRTSTPEPTLERFMRSATEHDVVSLLGIGGQQVGKAVTLASVETQEDAAKPDTAAMELVGTLAQRLVDLAAAGDQGEAQLHAKFLADYEFGEKKRAELAARKEALGNDLAQKHELHIQLIAVKKHLIDIRSELEERIKGVRLFAMNSNAVGADVMKQAKTLLRPAGH